MYLKYLITTLFCFAVAMPVWSKKSKKKETPVVATTSPPKKDGLKSIKEFTEKCSAISGLFPVYQDSTTGKTYLEIKEGQLNKEYIYFLYALDGVVDAGFFRGAYLNNKILYIQKYFDKIEILQSNTQYYFDPKNELSKAADANINRPLLASEKIVAMSVDTLDTLGNTSKRYLIEAEPLFLQETLAQIKPSKGPAESPNTFSMGSLSSKKTKFLRVKNYPANSDFEVEYVFDNPSPVVRGSTAVTDARSVTVKVRHTLIEMPVNDYRSRQDDPRVGYFTDEVTDMTSVSSTPYKDMINRWHLVKKNPELAVSEPIEPITFWIENTTPLSLRPIIKAATEKWNIAYEAAGFKNAVVCNIQPDTANWDAGDIRYNVIRWTSSPNPPFGGYGPSFTNPRTGQILGADIMLEWIFMTNRLRLEKVFDIAGMDLMSTEEETHSAHPHQHCMAGHYMHLNSLFGQALMNVNDFTEIQKDTFMTQALAELVLHEVGHTLGLNHNFIGSAFADNAQFQDKNYGLKTGISTSVMDYTIPNISPDAKNQGLYFDVTPGLYDIWAIRFGYTPFSEENEKAGVDAILSESTKPQNRFFNDADDMRSPGKGTDPRVMINDMTSDPVAYAIAQNEMNLSALKKLKEKYSVNGQSYHEMRNIYLILTGRYTTNLGIFSRWIGGVYVDRSFAGQNAVAKPFTPIEKSKQKEAMQALAKYAFAPDAFSISDDLYNYLQLQRRAYNTPTDGETPKLHDRILSSQKSVLDHLLHVNTLTRIVDSKLLGNEYSINEVLTDLTDAIVKQDLSGNVNTMRQNLQTEYVNRLLSIVDPKSRYNSVTKAAAFAEIDRIQKMVASGKGDAASNAHRLYLKYVIQQALEN